MSITDLNDWKEVTVNEMHLAFVQAEASKCLDLLQYLSPAAHPRFQKAVNDPDPVSPLENADRAWLLYSVRHNIVCEIPSDTKWFQTTLVYSDLHLLRVIGSLEWDFPGCDFELLKVAQQKPIPITSANPSEWYAPILWGNDKAGPFTIIEGNHRLTAFAGEGNSQKRPDYVSVVIGVSSSPYLWHSINRGP